ncbi:MAG: helix-turn-helix transcriptional regulator [Lachnospiraceae bacterium]|jgi:transcriptional regulator with XRE-family HTH domain|nr:helix-turn-helix transcriptional regulator [Lachnospiraceae bacterium]MEE0862964.1 helix-turn-helix transcriptional regulator [Lachnospiraceae bacterium]
MAKKSVLLEPNIEDKIRKMGQRIKKARLRRNISIESISEKAGISESTFYAIEHGASTVSLGAYAAVLAILGLDNDIDVIAVDEDGKALFWEDNIVERKRAKRR